eukprot:4297546-Alexandrium_andersonii.AAC.1
MLQWNPDARAPCSQVLEDPWLPTSAGAGALASSQGGMTRGKDASLRGGDVDNAAGALKEQQTRVGSESALTDDYGGAADGREEARWQFCQAPWADRAIT